MKMATTVKVRMLARRMAWPMLGVPAVVFLGVERWGERGRPQSVFRSARW